MWWAFHSVIISYNIMCHNVKTPQINIVGVSQCVWCFTVWWAFHCVNVHNVKLGRFHIVNNDRFTVWSHCEFHSVNHTVNHSVLHNIKLGRFHIVNNDRFTVCSTMLNWGVFTLWITIDSQSAPQCKIGAFSQCEAPNLTLWSTVWSAQINIVEHSVKRHNVNIVEHSVKTAQFNIVEHSVKRPI